MRSGTNPQKIRTDRIWMIVRNLQNEEKWTDKKFDMESWVTTDDKCGTVCCAFGSLMGDEEAEKAGLTFHSWVVPETKETKYKPVYGLDVGEDAVAEFLGIGGRLTRWLFFRSNYPAEVTKEHVLDRLYTVLALAEGRA